MKENLIYIIIVNYNGNNDTINCIMSLDQIEYSNYKVIIVDNHSDVISDIETLISENDRFELVKLGTNVGFSGANNIGIKIALDNDAENILLLNNDTEVEKYFLKRLVRKSGENVICCPNIYYFSNLERIWYTYGQVNFSKCIVENGDSSKKVTFASGCCMLLHKSVFEKIGMLPEEYFMYFEDVDYSINAVRNNIKIICVEEAVVYHKIGCSSGGNQSLLSIYYNNRNRFYIIKKYKLGLKPLIYTYITRIFRLFYGCVFNTNDRIIWKAYKDYRKNNLGKRNLS